MRAKIATLLTQMRRNWYWGLIVALALIAILYSWHRGTEQAYWDGAIGNWVATLLGIIAGVPIALAIEHQRVFREEREQLEQKRIRAVEISSMIKEELIYNSRGLSERLKDKNSLPLHPLKNDLWRALSDSGEIKWIDNSEVLNKISTAQYYIRIVSTIEEKCYQSIRGLNVKYDDGTFASQRLLADARKFDEPLANSISTAISVIEETYKTK